MRNDGINEYYYMYNGHSDVTALLKQDGTLAITYYYDAFGNIVEQGLIQEQNYSQNFDGSTLDGWASYGGTWTLANGNYSVASYPGAKTVLNNTNLADFVYEADVKITTGGDAGIIFRVSSPAVGADAYYGYYAGLDIWAQCIVLGKAANSWTRLAASSMSIVSGQVYHIKVVAKGTSIKVYVNDMNTPKISVTNSSFASGSIGVRVYNSNATFDNVSVSNSVLVPAEANNTINYAGYQYDKETGLYYCNARMYDPKTARFLSEDTYRGDPNDPLSLNLYTYCHNEPLMYDDPTGHFPHLLAGAAIGFAIGAGVLMVSDAFSGNLSAKNWKNYLGAGVQGAIVGTVAAATGGANLISMAGAGAAAGAVGNIANQSIRKAGTRKGIDAKELAASTIASGIGFGAAGAISKVAASVSSKIASTIASKVLQKTVEGEMILQKTFEGGMIGSVGNASSAFAYNVTSQTWDLANGNKKSFDFGSLGYETGIGALSGLGFGAAIGNVFSSYAVGKSAGKASKTYFNELDGWSIGETDAISNVNTRYSRLSGPTAGDNTGINLKAAGASEVSEASNVVPRTGPKGVDPAHHNLNVMVRDADGNIVSHERLVSGNMTAEEKVMGYPKGQNASHTEARFARYRGENLNEGDSVTMTGQLPPCNSCKGYLNRLATDKNVDIAYRWREDGVTKTWKVNR